jgi:aminopeptidase
MIIKELRKLAQGNSALRDDAQALITQCARPPADPAEYMEMAFHAERLAKIAAAGCQHNAALLEQLKRVQPALWGDAKPLPFDPQQQARLGRIMLDQLDLPPQGKLLIEAAPEGSRMVHSILKECFDNEHLELDVMVEDHAFDTTLVNGLNKKQLSRLVDFTKARYGQVTHWANIRGEVPPALGAMRDPAKFKVLAGASAEFKERRKNDDVRWILSRVPTREEAARDGFASYEDYLVYFYEGCDQPWDAIGKTQQKLIGCFNEGKGLHFTNSDGTDIRLSIDAHTFANSLIGRNLPGSEFFSGPVRESVNGRLVSKGYFSQSDGTGRTHVMKDIELELVDGRIVKATAAEGQEGLDAILNTDAGSRYFGEIGIGTNPHYRLHSANGMLVEKISGSFHLAIGECYGNKYLGEDVLMANGNKSAIHWDITTMLRGKEGRMELDGHLIQENGEWIACPELGITAEDVDVLNRGWAAIAEHQRPKYWRDKLAAQESALTR